MLDSEARVWRVCATDAELCGLKSVDIKSRAKQKGGEKNCTVLHPKLLVIWWMNNEHLNAKAIHSAANKSDNNATDLSTRHKTPTTSHQGHPGMW